MQQSLSGMWIFAPSSVRCCVSWTSLSIMCSLFYELDLRVAQSYCPHTCTHILHTYMYLCAVHIHVPTYCTHTCTHTCVHTCIHITAPTHIAHILTIHMYQHTVPHTCTHILTTHMHSHTVHTCTFAQWKNKYTCGFFFYYLHICFWNLNSDLQNFKTFSESEFTEDSLSSDPWARLWEESRFEQAEGPRSSLAWVTSLFEKLLCDLCLR